MELLCNGGSVWVGHDGCHLESPQETLRRWDLAEPRGGKIEWTYSPSSQQWSIITGGDASVL